MERPLFRTDLVSRPIEAGGDRFIEVTDPDSGHSFRFYEVEYAIACAMDGERDLPHLVEWAKIELGLEPSPDELRTVIGTLDDLGYLGEGDFSQPLLPEPLAPPPRLPIPGEDFDDVTRDGRLGDPGSPFTRAPQTAPTSPSPFDVELGVSGKGAAGARKPASGRDVELGAAGNKGLEPSVHDRQTRPTPALSRDEFGDELSVDLSEHLPVRTADVKEAVRQSRVMQAVAPPDDDMDEDKTPVPSIPVAMPTAAAAAAARRNTPPPVPAMSAALNKTMMGTMAPRSVSQPNPVTGGVVPGGRSPTPAPVILPDKLAEVSRPVSMPVSASTPAGARAVAPPRAEPRRSNLLPALLVLLLLAAAGAGAYWWFVLRDSGTAQGSPPHAPATVEAPVKRPDPPKPPAEVTAALEAGPSQEREVTTPRAGVVAWLAPAGSEVAEGAPIAKLDGHQRWEREVQLSLESQRRYQEKLDQTTSKGDKAGMKLADANVKRKQADIDKANVELVKFVIAAPAGGVVEPVGKASVRTFLKKGDPVAKILAQSDARATFEMPPGRGHAGETATVLSRADRSLKAECTVLPSDPGRLVVSCPTDSGLAPGTEVILKAP